MDPVSSDAPCNVQVLIQVAIAAGVQVEADGQKEEHFDDW